MTTRELLHSLVWLEVRHARHRVAMARLRFRNWRLRAELRLYRRILGENP